MTTRRCTLDEIATIAPGITIPGAITHDPTGNCYVLLPRYLSDAGDPVDMATIVDPVTVHLPGVQPERLLYDGDIVFASRGENNRACVVTNCPAYSVAPGMFYVLRMKVTTVLPEFLAWALNQQPLQTQIARIRTGAITPLVQREEFKHLTLSLPAIEQQQRIIELARLMHQERALVDQLQTLKSRYYQAIGKKLLTADVP